MDDPRFLSLTNQSNHCPLAKTFQQILVKFFGVGDVEVIFVLNDFSVIFVWGLLFEFSK